MRTPLDDAIAKLADVGMREPDRGWSVPNERADASDEVSAALGDVNAAMFQIREAAKAYAERVEIMTLEFDSNGQVSMATAFACGQAQRRLWDALGMGQP